MIRVASDGMVLGQRVSGIGSCWSSAAFCFGADAGERGADRSLPRGRDPAGPPLAGDAEVGAELTGIVKPGRAVVLGQRSRSVKKKKGDTG